jgi:hypothetical protein
MKVGGAIPHYENYESHALDFGNKKKGEACNIVDNDLA